MLACRVWEQYYVSHYQEDRKLHPIAYANRSVSAAEFNYASTNLEMLAVVWAVTHFKYFLYGPIITDHATVKAILGTPNLSGQHARWWTKLYGSGIKRLEMIHQAGTHNQHADALSRQPVSPATPSTEASFEVQVAQISGGESSGEPDHISELLRKDPGCNNISENSFADEQLNDPALRPIILYLLKGILPEPVFAAKTVAQSSLYNIVDGILYYTGQKDSPARAVVPCGLQKGMIEDYHGGIMAGYFSGSKVYKVISWHW